jgi:MFS family permease
LSADAQAPKSTGLKLNWGFTFLIGFGFFGVEVLWRLYNNFVPLYLQSGSAAFDATQKAPILGFGLNTFTSGLIMGLDNLAALFLLPVIGALSDRTNTRIGRRMPFILACAPVAALSFALIPLAPSLIAPADNGAISAMPGLFAAFVVILGIMLLAMACFRTPVISLMPDLTPSPLRSKANGVINLMGGLAGVLGTLALSPLFDVNPWIPFVCGAVILIAAVVTLFLTVREREASVVAAPSGAPPSGAPSDGEEERESLNVLKKLRDLPSENRRTLIFLMLAIFCWFVAFNGIDTWFTSFGVTVLDLTPGGAGQIFSVALIAFILFSIPAGFVGTRFGRRWTIIAGLVAFTGILLVINLLQNLTVITILLAIGGASWALVNINSLPMVVDTSTDERILGTYTGMYYIASQFAAILGPAITGLVVDLSGGDFRTIFVVVPAFFGLAVLAMLFVKRGESKPVDASGRAIE